MNAVLVHDEMLNSQSIDRCADACAMRIFVFDPTWLASEGWSQKRVQFVCDALVEIENIRVFKAPIAEVVHALNITSFTTQATPNNHVQALFQRAAVPVRKIEEIAFCQFHAQPRRFMSYWKAIEGQFF